MAEKDILYFTKKERTGILVLLAILLLLHFFSFLYEKFFEKPVNLSPDVLQRFSALTSISDSTEDQYIPVNEERKKVYTAKENSLFLFDPNTISLQEWNQLGVKQKTAQTILKYISKGGKFRKPEDLKKVWGLQHDAEKLIPFVRIRDDQKSSIAENKIVSNVQQQKIDINKADSLTWLSLPGIGPALTKRILTFRRMLGGFYALHQVKETFGLPDSTYQKIKSRLVLNSGEIKKINVNEAGIDELKKHPYIRYYLANAIVQYRSQHGRFQALEELKNIMILPDSSYVKMLPYLSIQ